MTAVCPAVDTRHKLLQYKPVDIIKDGPIRL